MWISTKGRYGARAMLMLACRYGTGPVPGQQIADDQGLSPKYLEALLAGLKRGGLVVAERGKNGGYVLARPPAEITLYEVLLRLEGPLGFVPCTLEGRCCERMDTCATRDVWSELKETTERILKRTSLEHLRRRQMALDRRARRA